MTQNNADEEIGLRRHGTSTWNLKPQPSTATRGIRIENHEPLALVKAHAEMLEDVEPPQQMESNPELIGETDRASLQ